MKTESALRLFLKLALVGVIVAFLVGCPQPEEDDSVSIPERINAFISNLNTGSYDTLYTHLHPTTSQYNQKKDGDTWLGDFPSSTYSIGTLEISGAIATTTISGGTYSSRPIRFTMLEDGRDVWMIDKLEIDKTSGYETIVE